MGIELVQSIIPGLTYNNTSAAIEWLDNALDFQKHPMVRAKTGKLFMAN